MNDRLKRLAGSWLVCFASLGLSLPTYAAETQTTIRSPEFASAGEPVTFSLSFPSQSTEVLGDIWGDAADRPSDISVQFEPDENCQYFPDGGKFHCNLSPSSDGVGTLTITIITQKPGFLELRGHTKLRTQLSTWAAEPVRILPSGK